MPYPPGMRDIDWEYLNGSDDPPLTADETQDDFEKEVNIFFEELYQKGIFVDLIFENEDVEVLEVTPAEKKDEVFHRIYKEVRRIEKKISEYYSNINESYSFYIHEMIIRENEVYDITIKSL